jgi:hypothetical protein
MAFPMDFFTVYCRVKYCVTRNMYTAKEAAYNKIVVTAEVSHGTIIGG